MGDDTLRKLLEDSGYVPVSLELEEQMEQILERAGLSEADFIRVLASVGTDWQDIPDQRPLVLNSFVLKPKDDEAFRLFTEAEWG